MVNTKPYSDIKTGVIGSGIMGKNHARVYNELSNLVCVSDTNGKVGKQVANEHGVKFYEDYRDMLSEVDAVSIAVPTIFHKQIAENVANAGVHMLVEKPLSNNISDAQAIVNCAHDNSLVLAVGHIERHNPVVEYAKNQIEGGKWGKIITASACRVSPYPSRITDVGAIFDITIHDIDVLRYLFMSDIESVYCSGGSIHSKDHEEFVSLILNFSNGAKGVCETSWLTPIKIRELSLTCSSHFVKLDYINQSIDIKTSEYLNLNQDNLFSSSMEIKSNKIMLPKQEPLKLELEDFLNCVINNSKPLVDGNDALTNIVVANAALTSLQTEDKVKIIE